MSKISYSAVVLDEISHEKLVLLLGKYYPDKADSWRIYAHHMTMCMGELPTEKKSLIGTKCSLTVISIGLSDKACAARISDEQKYLTTNKIPHVTLAVNPNGGKPVMSNDIPNWQDLDGTIVISGIVMELAR